jgi:hypothetical protein
MLEEIKFRWRLRKYLNDVYEVKSANDDRVADPMLSDEEVMEARRFQGSEEAMLTQHVAVFTSEHLVKQAYLLQIPITENEGDWLNARYVNHKRYLSQEAAQKLRDEIRSEQKARWEYWQGRITLCISVVALIVAFLAYVKK